MKDLFDISGRGAMVTEPLVLDSISDSLKYQPTGLQTCPNKH